MLKHLALVNCQRHHRLTLELDPRVTVLTGRTDAGKSACLRALRWLVFNRPAGASLLRHGTKTLSVTLQVDGHALERRKGPGNSYRVDGKELKALGSAVPEEVTQLLNLGPENFQRQLDAPFWFCLSAGELSKQLNAVVDLSLLDRTLDHLAAKIRRAKATVEVVQERHQQAEGASERLAWTKEAMQQFQELQTRQERLATRRSKWQQAANLADRYRTGAPVRYLRLALDFLEPLLKQASWAVHEEQQLQTLQALRADLARTKEAACHTRQEQKRVAQKLRQYRHCPLCGGMLLS